MRVPDKQLYSFKDLENILNSFRLAGVSAFPLSREVRKIVFSKSPGPIPQSRSHVPSRAISKQPSVMPAKQPPAPVSNQVPKIDENKKFVFTIKGEGDPKAEFIVLRDIHSDKTKRDDADFLLDKIIQGGMKMNKESVYVINISHDGTVDNSFTMGSISPENRLDIQKAINRINPLLVIAMGSVVTSLLFKEKVDVKRVRGQWKECDGILVMPTHHPWYVVNHYTTKVRGEVFADIKMVLQELKKC